MSCNHDTDTGYAMTPAQPGEVGWVQMPFEVDICGDIIPAGDLPDYARRLHTNLSEADTPDSPPQPQPAAVVLPTVEEVAATFHDNEGNAVPWADRADFVKDPMRRAARAVLDLIAARLPVWQPVEPGTVIKAGTRWRHEDGQGWAEEGVADQVWHAWDDGRGRVHYLDPRTVPAEPEDPRVAVVLDWYLNSEAPGTDADLARDLLARLDAVRADA